ncbi:MAG: arsenate reductase ArsC [Pseudomonadota bacterium]
MPDSHLLANRGPIQSVLYICSQNVIRSPIAEALTKLLFPGRIFAESAGVMAGAADPFVEAVMAERGVDLSGHVPKGLDELEDSYFDLYVTLTPQAHHRILDSTRDQAVLVEYWPMMDPADVTGSRETILNAYRNVREALQRRIEDRLSN